MAASMARFFYCEVCATNLACVYEPWRGAWVLSCPRCPENPERLVVTPSTREQYTGEERAALERLIARDAEEPPILGRFTPCQPSTALEAKRAGSWEQWWLGLPQETTPGILPPGRAREGSWERWSGDDWGE